MSDYTCRGSLDKTSPPEVPAAWGGVWRWHSDLDSFGYKYLALQVERERKTIFGNVKRKWRTVAKDQLLDYSQWAINRVGNELIAKAGIQYGQAANTVYAKRSF